MPWKPDLLGCTLSKAPPDGGGSAAGSSSVVLGMVRGKRKQGKAYVVQWNDGTSEELQTPVVQSMLDKFDVGDEVEVRFDDKKWYAADLEGVPTDDDKKFYVTFHATDTEEASSWDFSASEACRLRSPQTPALLPASPTSSVDASPRARSKKRRSWQPIRS